MSFAVSSNDDEELVHNAVRQGYIISLEIYLNQNPGCINKLYKHNQSVWTPLIAACFYGYEHIVRMLLSRFKANIEAVGEVFFKFPDNESYVVKNVSPLLVAIAVNHFDIVKLLVEYGGANVRHLTQECSTTFRVACYVNNLDMARYLVKHGADPYQAKKGNFTNLMLAVEHQNMSVIRYLIDEIKCDINERDDDSQTALYYAVRAESIEITKFLLEHGALNIRDTLRKVTPLMRAALFGKISLVDAFEGYCTDVEWIEAKELLAANLAGCVPSVEDRSKTIELFTETFKLRESKNLPKSIVVEPLKLFNYHHECETLGEFQKLIALNSDNALDIEVTLIHQRLLGDISKDYHHVLIYNAFTAAQNNRYDDSLGWWFYVIDLKQKHNMSLTKEDLHQVARIFVRIMENNNQYMPMNDLLRMLKIMDNVLLKSTTDENIDYHLNTLLCLLTIVSKILYNQDRINQQKECMNSYRDLFKAVHNIIRRQYRTTKTHSTLLHLCSLYASTNVHDDLKYLSSETIHLLIDCGADVDAFDIHDNTPLHILTTQISSTNVLKMIDLLCDAGAHLDYLNKARKVPLQLIPSYRTTMIEQMKKKMDVVRLKCLCARLIREQQFSIQNSVSTSLLNFVEKH